ncbi:terminase [Lysinibacillus sp. PLM2]|nr:terminase [Lysinibacillus sp. PLM2]
MAVKKVDKLKIINDSPKLWLQNFVRIVDNNGDLVPFKVNEQQESFINDMVKFNIIAKARQIGFSTLSLGLCLYYACLNKNTNYLLVSYKSDSSTSLFEKLKMMYDSLPHDKYTFPNIKRSNRDEFVLNNGSRIQCAVAGVKDIGRGTTYQYILLSEFAFYANQEKVLLSAEQALAKNEHSRIVIETTSNGFNHYQKIFMNAFKGKSKYKSFFFPFYSSAYIKQFKHEYDQAEEWYKEINQGQRLRPDELDSDEKILYEKGASLKQLMWRRWKLLDMSIQEFYQEFPSNPMESFISSGFSVFDQSKVLERINGIPREMDKTELKEIPDLLQRYLGKGLFIYKLPKRYVKYFGGVDTASGSGADFSSISIIDSDGEQVASFYNNKVPVYLFAEIIECIGKFYNYAFLVVERNSYGLPLLERLRKEYEYLNLYKQKVFNQSTGKKQMKLGWQTSQVTKSVLVSDFKEYFEQGMVMINCRETLSEMQIFVESDGKTGNKRGDNNHDDLVISFALAVQGIKANKWYV